MDWTFNMPKRNFTLIVRMEWEASRTGGVEPLRCKRQMRERGRSLLLLYPSWNLSELALKTSHPSLQYSSISTCIPSNPQYKVTPFCLTSFPNPSISVTISLWAKCSESILEFFPIPINISRSSQSSKWSSFWVKRFHFLYN